MAVPLEVPAPQVGELAAEVIARLTGGTPRTPPQVAFYPYTGGRSTVREREGALLFRLNAGLLSAPDTVLEGVLEILVTKVRRTQASRANPAAVRAYRDFLNHLPSSARAASASRGRKHIDPVGTHRSLVESYLRVTLDMGLTLPRIPTLSWSKTVSRRRFGHWDPDHNAVVLSQALDDPGVPEFVLDYVLYHELLHILHPVVMGAGTKRRIHTAAFRRDERRFPRWQEGERWLQRLARSR